MRREYKLEWIILLHTFVFDHRSKNTFVNIILSSHLTSKSDVPEWGFFRFSSTLIDKIVNISSTWRYYTLKPLMYERGRKFDIIFIVVPWRYIYVRLKKMISIMFPARTKTLLKLESYLWFKWVGRLLYF